MDTRLCERHRRGVCGLRRCAHGREWQREARPRERRSASDRGRLRGDATHRGGGHSQRVRRAAMLHASWPHRITDRRRPLFASSRSLFHARLPEARWLACLVLLLSGCADDRVAGSAEAQSAAGASNTIAFVGANVLPMDRETVLAEHTVLVRDGRIVEVGPTADVEVPEGAQRIDARGRWLMPGLAEMHGHVPGPDDETYAEDVLFLYVLNGVTTVRNMAGHAYHLGLRDGIAAGELVGPTLFAASPWLSEDQAGTPEAADRIVREYRAAGFDLIKIGSIPRDAYLQMSRTAHE